MTQAPPPVYIKHLHIVGWSPDEGAKPTEINIVIELKDDFQSLIVVRILTAQVLLSLVTALVTQGLMVFGELSEEQT